MVKRKASDGSDVYPSNATEMVRGECGKAARHQGGTVPTSAQPYRREETSMEDIAGGDPPSSGGNGMGYALGEHRVRNSDGYYYMD